MKKIKAFIFDMNGTMIDDMPYHIKAWHDIVTRLGASLTVQQVKEQCYGKNEELLERIFPGRFTLEEKKQLEHDTQVCFRKVMAKQGGKNDVWFICWKSCF